MQVSIETTSGLERRLTVGVPADRVDGAVDQRLREAARNVRLPGFRPGKVPMKRDAAAIWSGCTSGSDWVRSSASHFRRRSSQKTSVQRVSHASSQKASRRAKILSTPRRLRYFQVSRSKRLPGSTLKNRWLRSLTRCRRHHRNISQAARRVRRCRSGSRVGRHRVV